MHNTTQYCTKIGYARVSTQHQDEDSQCRILLGHVSQECIFVDKVSGKIPASSRPGYKALLNYLDTHPGVTELYIFELSRLGRNYPDSISTMLNLEERGVRVISLSDKEAFINEISNITMRRMMLSFMLSMAEMEREKIQERVKAGLDAAQARGVKLGQPKKDIDVQKVQEMRESGKTLQEIAAELGVHENTLRNRIHGKVKP